MTVFTLADFFFILAFNLYSLDSATCLRITGSETGFLAQNVDRLLDRDFQGRISDRKAEQVFKTEKDSRQDLRQVLKQDRAPCSV